MVVAPGYKQTEVGVIPEDWGEPQLSELVKDDAPICYGIVQVGSYTANGVPVLAIKNLNTDYITNIHRASAEIERAYARSRIRPDDVVISVKGTTGRVGIVPIGFYGNISRDLARLRLTEQVASEFCFQMLQSDLMQQRLAVAVVGTTRMELSIAILRQVRIPLPPTLAEQRAIAAALSDADALIESLEQLIAKKRAVKQGAMQELLTGRRRLPGFEGIGWRNSEVGDVPEDWNVKEIGQIADVKTGPFGSALHERDYVDDGTPIITVEHLGEMGVEHFNLPMVSNKDLKRLSSYTLMEGDIVFSRVGSVDRNARISKAEQGWLFSGRLLRLRATSGDVDTNYLSYQFHSEPFKQRVKTVAVGQTMASLNTQILKGVLVVLPLFSEQTAIATLLSDMDTELDALEAKLAKARQVKQGMMQELLTGRTRLV